MRQLLKVNQQRMLRRIEELSQIGKTEQGGVTRKALTLEDQKGLQLIKRWMVEAGLTVRTDHAGNVIGRREGTDTKAPAVIIGSHIDTVPNGGNFDGTIGVIGGIEIATIIQEENLQLPHPLEVISFSDEEGTRFQGGLFGSRAMVGTATEKDLQAKDEKGITRAEALKNVKLNPNLLATVKRTPDQVKVFLEMHIEQGPYLELVDKPIGIVTGIAGPSWLSVKIQGQSGHAGTVPMSLRNDPMGGAAEVIQAIETIATKDPSAATVATVGKIEAFPNGTNVIPEYVEFTLDLRDIDLKRRNDALRDVKKAVNQICEKRRLTYDITEHLIQDPIQCAVHIIETMRKVGDTLGLEAPPMMISGAGHDAMIMSEITDIGLLFVRCKNGISHNPNEWASIEDIEVGTSLLLETTLNYMKS
ncbi:M20 family metallo-hydrolase [Alkalihalobacterium elongatum]|uniref:M20 family metallo-hydrolase n=1 Tax=Alkalihalobacterium elongatum TaxID=2675466 RepID=UPI001C1F5F09|nr:M20 family metallo-hydrolase [Alkalihalobacterium elongatum]